MLFAAAVLLVAAITVFYGMQQYIVYEQDGLFLALPFLGQNASGRDDAPSTDDVVAELEIIVTDFESIPAIVPENLTEIHAVNVPAESVTEAGLTAAVAKMEAVEANALVLEMKTTGGKLSWFSTVQLAADYGVNGSLVINDLIASLKEQNVYLIAKIPCCVDDLMAIRNAPLALRDSTGKTYSDESGAWLDPYNQEVRTYAAELGSELFAMGFDELLLTHVAHPDAEVIYTRELSTAQDRGTIVNNLALAVTDALRAEETAGVISAQLDPAVLRAAEGSVSENGQSTAFFWKIFDRVWCTSDGTILEADRAVCSGILGNEEDGSTRFVPILPAKPETGSWQLS